MSIYFKLPKNYKKNISLDEKHGIYAEINGRQAVLWLKFSQEKTNP